MKTELTDEQKRIRIAELCGWKIEEDGELTCYTPPWIAAAYTDPSFAKPVSEMTDEGIPDYLPDYLNSLDAMHEAEKLVSSKHRQSDYVERLRDAVLYDTSGCDWWVEYELAHATARQRAEAFLATMDRA